MVQTARASTGPGAVRSVRGAPETAHVRALNTPRPVHVETDAVGCPLAVTFGLPRRSPQPSPVMTEGKRFEVVSIEDAWRVQDEWWRHDAVSRTYFEVLLEDGRRVCTFQDHVTGTWYEQRYG